MAFLMFLLAFVVAYPIFMIMIYILSRLIFSKIGPEEAAANELKFANELSKAQRIKKRKRSVKQTPVTDIIPLSQAS